MKNDELEREARMLSEEKGLPYEFAKGMLEFMERESKPILNEQTYSRPISEKLTFLWVNESLEIFKSIMPSFDVPFPSIYTTTTSNFTRVRNKIVKEVRCPHKEAPDTSIMEYIHGNGGGAILIRRDLIGNLPVQDESELYYYFQHFIWHELGHFYAINSETDNLHRYNNPGLTDDSQIYDLTTGGCGLSSERKKQEGYWFWQEFIAEVISNHVSYVYRSKNDNYHPELIDWTVDIWKKIKNKLSGFLEATLYEYPSTIDEYALAHYFATLLTDDLTGMYLEAANSGKLKDENGLILKNKLEPTCITDLLKFYQQHIRGIFDVLKVQLANDYFWLTDESTLENIGACIGGLMVEKIKDLAGCY